MLSKDEVTAARSVLEGALAFDRAELALGWALGEGVDKEAFQEAAGAVLRVGQSVGMIPFSVLMGDPQTARQYRDGLLEDALPAALRWIEATKELTHPINPHLDEALLQLKEARSSLQKADLTLAFAAPAFEQAPAVGKQTIVGPHGDYFEFQRKIFAAQHYWREWATHWLQELRATMGAEKLFAEAFRLYTLCVSWQYRAAALAAGISLYWKWDPLDQFCRTLKALELLQSIEGGEGAPEFYHATVLSWSQLARPTVAYQRSLLRLSDSWRNSDMAAWQLMVFPNSKRCTFNG